tara:strand:- start:5142 stop:5357 length:216 start_codon:yes stop_codon:yes gene_type:complete
MESIYEQFFYLKYSGGWSFIEAYNLPVGLRKWFMQRLIKQLEREKESAEKGKGGGSDSTQTLTPHNAPHKS